MLSSGSHMSTTGVPEPHEYSGQLNASTISALVEQCKYRSTDDCVAELARMSRPTVKMHLLGAFQVIGPNDENLTPKGQKARALVALVAVADRGQRTRAWLCSKLWSDRAPEQASASLRQTLTEIRRALGPYKTTFLQTDSLTVSFSLSELEIDTAALRYSLENSTSKQNYSQIGDFLEGIDVQDPEFEEWLSTERSYWDRLREENVEVNKHAESSRAASKNVKDPFLTPFVNFFSQIDILPPKVSSQHPQAFYVANFIADRFTQAATDNQYFKIFDRRLKSNDVTLELPSRRSPIAFVCTIYGETQNLTAQLKLFNCLTSEIEWQATFPVSNNTSNLERDPGLYSRISWAVEAAVRLFQKYSRNLTSEPNIQAQYLIFSAIDDLFGIDSERLKRAEKDIRRSLELMPHSQTLAWLAYLSTFKVGQNIVRLDQGDIEEIESIACEALTLDSNNPITLALCAHVFNFVLLKQEYAIELFTKSLSINPNRPLTWDLFSVLHCYDGKPEIGLKCAQWARELGSFSPYTYFYDTSCCMNAALGGQHEKAVQYGIRALNAQPKFAPALRYVVTSLGQLRSERDTQMWVEKLIKVDPKFSTDQFLQGRHLHFTSEQIDRLRNGFARAGVNK